MKNHITGIGCISAAGTTLLACMHNIDAGNVVPAYPLNFQVSKQQPVFQCDLEQVARDTFAPLSAPTTFQSHRIPLNELNRTAQLAYFATLQALAQARLGREELQSLRVGVCIGTSVGNSLAFFDSYAALRQGALEDTQEIHRYMASNPAEVIARIFDTRGPILSIANACSSGSDALGIAKQWLDNDQCDLVIAGGADALAKTTYLGFQSLKITSDAPCKPFDANRNGLNLGEGAAIFILEGNTKRSPVIPSLGAIVGYGTCTDAHHLTAPHSDAVGLNAALKMALYQTGLAKECIAFINAHGTATPTNDATEGRFIKSHFPTTPFLSTKGSTGHTLGAAGAIEAALTLAHLNRLLIPASPAFTLEDPAIGISPVQKPTKITQDYAISQSLAFGGNNSLLILKRGDHESLR